MRRTPAPFHPLVVDLPPPGARGRLDRFGAWVRARPGRPWLVLASLIVTLVPLLLAAWIGILMLANSSNRDTPAAALNVLSVVLLAASFPLAHRAMYRWAWHLERRRAVRGAADEKPTYGSEATEPAPRVNWPGSLRRRHAVLYLAAIAALLAVFAPYDNQRRIAAFVARHSIGSASAGSLDGILFAWLPMLLLTFLVVALTHRQMRLRDAGRLADRQQLLLVAELNWLFAYVGAFCMTALLCRLVGGAIADLL